jgi:membrane protein DedA with SNARE-associated domain
MRTLIKQVGTAAIAGVAIIGLAGSANAQHHHHGGGGFGPGFVGGFAAGAAIGSGAYYGGGYYGGPYAYDYGEPYAYASGCYIRRQVFVNRWGHRTVRRVRVCD